MSTARRPSLPDTTLDRRSFVPLYQQLEELLSRQIQRGRWRPGDLMPSELELSRHFNLSRMVVRQALAILEDAHQITRHRGRGTFVAEPSVEHRASGLTTLLRSPRATQLGVTVVETAIEATEARVARRLGIRGKAVRVTTLLSLSGTPAAVSHSFFDRARSEWVDRISAGDDLRARINAPATLPSTGVEVMVEAAACESLEARLLGVPAGAPAYLVSAVELDRRGGRALEISEARYRADLFRCRLGVTTGPMPALMVAFSLVDGIGRRA